MASKMISVAMIFVILYAEGFRASGSLLGKFIPEQPATDESVLNIINKPMSVLFARDPKPILANEITSILSLALGFSVPKEIEWKGLLSGNPFNKPDAVVMFSVDSVPSDQNLKIAASGSIPVKVDDEDVSRTDMLSLSGRRTLNSHLSEIYDGKAYTLSLSANEDLAAAGYSDGEKSQTIVWSKKDNAWLMLDSKNPKGDLLFTKEQLLSEMDTILNSKDIRYDQKKEQMVVKMKTAEIHFNLKSEADFLFFSELAVAKLLLSKIASKSDVIKDAVPDAYMIGISSLKNLQKVYGVNSPQVKAAIFVIEEFIPKMTEKFVELYNGNVLVVQLSLKTSKEALASDSNDSNGMYNQVKSHLGKNGIEDFYIRFQELHIASDIENHARQSLCKQMTGLVSGFGVNMKFKCANEEDSHHLIRRSLLAAKNQTVDINSLNLASAYDNNFPVIFNLWFWLLVVLFLSVYVISLVMWYMDPGRDSIIYRMTSQRIKSD